MTVVLLVVALFAALPAAAQPEPKARVGFLSPDPPTAAEPKRWLDAFRQGLRERGWEEGRNVVIEPRWAHGRYDRLGDLAAELVRVKVDVIVTDSTPAARAAKKATRSRCTWSWS